MSSEPVGSIEWAREVRAMNERTARRREQAPEGSPVPIAPPTWAVAVVDTGEEIVAIHSDTHEPYPLDVHADLSVEDHAVVVARRVLSAGGSRPEIQRLLWAFGLDQTARARLLRRLREEIR
jgi:hypothetical protein